jgi:serine protease Do
MTSDEKKESKLERGLVVEDVAGPAERAGVRPGDVILSVNRTPVESLEQMKSLIDKSGKGVAL